MTPTQPKTSLQRSPFDMFQSFFGAVAPQSIRMKLIYAFITVAFLSTSGTTLASNLLLNGYLTEGASSQIDSTATTTGLMVGELLHQEVSTLQAFGVNKVVRDTVERLNATYPADRAGAQKRVQELDKTWRVAASSDPIITTRLNNLVASELRAYRSTFPDNVEVFVTDQYGGVVAATNQTSDYAQADEDWWQAAWNNGRGAVYISQASVDESSRSFGMIIAVPLYNETADTVIGILRSTYRLDTIVQRVSRTNLGRTGGVKIMLPDQKYLTDATTATPFSADEAQQLVIERGDTWVMPLYGVERVVSVAPVTTTENAAAMAALGWRVLAYQDRAEIMGVAQETLKTSLLVGLAMLLVASLLAIVFARTVSMPIQRLTHAAQQIAAGAFDQRIKLGDRDEIGTLATRFNEMAATVQQRTAALEAQYAQAEAARAEAERAHADIATHLSTIEQQQAVIREMSVPILPVTASALVMPLVGSLDSARMHYLQTHALSTLEQLHARHLIVDVTGVPIIDTYVAGCLLQLIQGAKLLGTEVVLVGIRPEVAQTLVGLGVPLDMMLARGSLQEGIAYAERRTASASKR